MQRRLIAWFAKFFIKASLWTCRVQIEGIENLDKAKKEGPVIIMLWHNRLTIIAEILAPLARKFRFAAFISNSRDGEILSNFILSYPCASVIRVPHNARDKALKTMILTLRQGDLIVLITPDGPKGPVYKVKPGIVMAAKESNASVVPFTWESSHLIELKTWDKMRFPRPFSTIKAIFGEPHRFADETTYEEGAELLREKTLSLVK